METKFSPAGEWVLDGDNILPKGDGLSAEGCLYAFLVDGQITYIGHTHRSIAERMQNIRNASSTQATNVRIKEEILNALRAGQKVEIQFDSNSTYHRENLVSDKLIAVKSLQPAWNVRHQNNADALKIKEIVDNIKNTEYERRELDKSAGDAAESVLQIIQERIDDYKLLLNSYDSIISKLKIYASKEKKFIRRATIPNLIVIFLLFAGVSVNDSSNYDNTGHFFGIFLSGLSTNNAIIGYCIYLFIMYCGWAWVRVKIKITEAEKNSTVSETIEKRVLSLQENGLDLFYYFEKITADKAKGNYRFGHRDSLNKQLDEVSQLKIDYEIKSRREAVEKDILRRNSFIESLEEYLCRLSFLATTAFTFSIAAVNEKGLLLTCVLIDWEFYVKILIPITFILFAIWLLIKGAIGLMNHYFTDKEN